MMDTISSVMETLNLTHTWYYAVKTVRNTYQNSLQDLVGFLPKYRSDIFQLLAKMCSKIVRFYFGIGVGIGVD
jgi:hypothetical protein